MHPSGWASLGCTAWTTNRTRCPAPPRPPFLAVVPRPLRDGAAAKGERSGNVLEVYVALDELLAELERKNERVPLWTDATAYFEPDAERWPHRLAGALHFLSLAQLQAGDVRQALEIGERADPLYERSTYATDRADRESSSST